MANIIPFKALRPEGPYAQQVAAPPYDVCSTEEAMQYQPNPYHFFHITRSEIDLPAGTDVHSAQVYKKALENLQSFIEKHILKRDSTAAYYIYRLVMNGKEQTGLLCASSIEDYNNGIIKKHEYTRPEKEQDRIDHMIATRAQTGVVFLAYRNVNAIDKLIDDWKNSHAPAYDFEADDYIRHTLWVVDETSTINTITELFKKGVPATYIADGHHRAASAAKVAKELGTEAAQYFLTCIFPESQVHIMDYNRVVKDLNGLSQEAFINKLEANFIVTKEQVPYKPQQSHMFGMYLPGKGWYRLQARDGSFDNNDAINSLDVSILQNNILSDLLNINDPRTDKRVDFVGGIRGLEGLQKRVDSGEMAAAFACYPVQLSELFAVADSGKVMPPKSTWFEPKTRDGLIIYTL